MTDAIQLLNPVVDLGALKERYEYQRQFVKEILKEGIDYGIIPGTNKKNVLLKAGAEKFTTLFGLRIAYVQKEEIFDPLGTDYNGEAFIHARYEAQLWRGNEMLGNAEGSCNSWEAKYRYRSAQLKCPVCGEVGTVIKGKEEYGGGWLCWAKKGGCGTKWPDGTAVIEEQKRGKVPNPNVVELHNTIIKMAQKRALVAVVLNVGNVSDYFTQDLEDLDFGVTISVVEKEEEPETITVNPFSGREFPRALAKLEKEILQGGDYPASPKRLRETVLPTLIHEAVPANISNEHLDELIVQLVGNEMSSAAGSKIYTLWYVMTNGGTRQTTTDDAVNAICEMVADLENKEN